MCFGINPHEIDIKTQGRLIIALVNGKRNEVSIKELTRSLHQNARNDQRE